MNCKRGGGKFLTNDTPVRIPDGWKAIGDIKVGDEVISVDGSKTKVLGVYPHKNQEIFRITFADGRSTKCGADHLWNVYHPDFDAVQRNGNRKPVDGFGKAFRTLDTATIKKRLSSGTSWSRRHYIDLPESGQNEDKKYFIDPYILGCILGDGGISYKAISLAISSPSVIERMITKLRPG